MSGQFKVGEVLVGQNFIHMPSYNGMECVVLAGLQMRRGFGMATREPLFGQMYRVQWANGYISSQFPRNLRRKQSPAGEESILRMFTAPAPSEVETA